MDGVTSTRVGYTGGHAPSPGYKQVCRGKTGHAEAVEVTFDPDRVSFGQLLERFWATHNPTTMDRQGFDIGSQYRSAIFFHDEAQQVAALDSLQKEQSNRRRRIVTQVEPAAEFWKAEDPHQQYLEKRGQASCAVGVA